MGIAIHNMSTSAGSEPESIDLAAGVRQNASGILNTTVQLGDLVTLFTCMVSYLHPDIPFR